MKNYWSLLIFLIFSNNNANGHSQSIEREKQSGIEIKFYDKVEYLTINKLVHYQIPYITSYNKPLENDYFPEWYWGYCASSYPPVFENYSRDALRYFQRNRMKSERELKLFEAKWRKAKREDFRYPYGYVFGEIWVTDNESEIQYIMVLEHSTKKFIEGLDYNKLDTSKFIRSLYQESDTSDNFYPIYATYGSAIIPYIYEDQIWKRANTRHFGDTILSRNRENLFFRGSDFPEFITMLNRASSYTRSRIVDGKRIFETVKNTPEGPVVKDENDGVSVNKLWYLKYLLAIIVAVAVLFALVRFLIQLRKK